MKTAKDVEEICKKLKPVIGDQADKLWFFYLAEDEKGRKNMALDIEIIAEKLLKKETLTNQKILLEPPSKADSTGSFVLGNAIYNDKKLHSLHLKPEDFIKQVGIFAVTGEGKTNLAYLLEKGLAGIKLEAKENEDLSEKILTNLFQKTGVHMIPLHMV